MKFWFNIELLLQYWTFAPSRLKSNIGVKVQYWTSDCCDAYGILQGRTFEQYESPILRFKFNIGVCLNIWLADWKFSIFNISMFYSLIEQVSILMFRKKLNHWLWQTWNWSKLQYCSLNFNIEVKYWKSFKGTNFNIGLATAILDFKIEIFAILQ